MVQWTRHDAPRDGVTHAGAQVAQAFGLQLEQTLVARKAYIEHTLGAIETETRTLTACNEECGDFALTEENFTRFFPEVVTEIVGREFPRHRSEVGRNVIAQAGCGLFCVECLEFLPVLAQNIAFQICAGITRQGFQMLGQFLLTCGVQSFDNIHAM